MNRKKYEAPLHGRAKKNFDDDDSDDDEDDDQKKSASNSTGRRARAEDTDEDHAHYIDGKDFIDMLQKKKTVRRTSLRSTDAEGSLDSENIPVEKKAGRRFLRDKPTRKKGAVEYFSTELDDDEKESIRRSKMKADSLTEEMIAKKALKDAKFKRLLTRKEADDEKRFRD